MSNRSTAGRIGRESGIGCRCRWRCANRETYFNPICGNTHTRQLIFGGYRSHISLVVVETFCFLARSSLISIARKNVRPSQSENENRQIVKNVWCREHLKSQQKKERKKWNQDTVVLKLESWFVLVSMASHCLLRTHRYRETKHKYKLTQWNKKFSWRRRPCECECVRVRACVCLRHAVVCHRQTNRWKMNQEIRTRTHRRRKESKMLFSHNGCTYVCVVSFLSTLY